MRRWLNAFAPYFISTLVVAVLLRRSAHRWEPRELGIDVLIAAGLSLGLKVVADAITVGVGRVSGRRR